jgi:Lar family restriction alleviation protein
MEVLKKCPFCGSDAEVYEFTIVKEYTVRCSKCPASMEDFNTPDDAVRVWNTRSNGVANNVINPTAPK